MLWLCLRPTRLCLEAVDTGQVPDLAIIERRGPRSWVIDSRCAIEPGTDLGAAMALHPIQPQARRPEAEQESLRQLAYLAYSLGSPVHTAMNAPVAFGGSVFHAVWVEASASLRLFGGLRELLTATQALLERLDLTISLGTAPTIEGAALAADHGQHLRTREALRQWLVRRPIGVLRMRPDLLAKLDGCGLHWIGDLLQLPAGALRRRFGAELPDLLARLTGDVPDPREPIVPPDRFERRFELLGGVETTDGLLIPVRRLLVELAHYLRARDTGAAAFELAFLHENKTRTSLAITLMAPTRSANHFLLITRERLARTTIHSPVTELYLRADRFDAPDTAQLDLFDTVHQHERDWATLLERLTARLGPQAVWTPGLVADHRPEKACAALPPGAQGVKASFPPRPAWLLRQPRALPRAPRLLAHERLQGGWWSPVDRDYAIAQARDGTRQWIYQDRASGQWYLHGLWE